MSDTEEAKRRAEWLHKHNARKDWRILSLSEIAVIRDELLVLERERDEERANLKITQEAWVKAKVERVEALRERDELAALLAAEKATRNLIIEKAVKTERELAEASTKINDLDDAASRLLVAINKQLPIGSFSLISHEYHARWWCWWMRRCRG